MSSPHEQGHELMPPPEDLNPSQRARYEQAIDAAAQVLADVRARMAALTPRQAAEEAYVPGGPSVDDLEAKIQELRAHIQRQQKEDP